ncbi:MAG TPA: thymidine kinase [Candidatus Magasanikbacteria bacterium]|nr:thymidine kinase [Candidatus Magasanikbacteria bacterium]
MNLTLILGPMKSGKTLELISRISPLKFMPVKFALFQPVKNVRDAEVESRAGAMLQGQKIKSLQEILNYDLEIVGIDEIHMFNPEEISVIEKLLQKQIKVIISGLDMDYRGKLFQIISGLIELGPKEIIFKRSVCEKCLKYNGVYTQIFKNNLPVTQGLPSIVPDDGTYLYKPVCRDCFDKK